MTRRPATEPVSSTWPLRRLEGGNRRAHGVGGAEHVRQHHRAPVLGRLFEPPALGAEAGVGEDHVHLAERVRRRRDQGLVGLPLGHVGLDRQRVLRAAELLDEPVELVLRPCGEHDAVAGLDGTAGGGGADAGAGTGDHEDAGHAGSATR